MKKLALLALLLSSPSWANDNKITYSTGFDYSVGKYGQAEDTKITYVPFSAKMDSGRWTFRATVPYLQIEGPANVIADSRVVIAGTTRPTRSKESGLGDVVLGTTYGALVDTNGQLYVDLGAKVKLPTADEKRGLGSGKTDYSIYTDVIKGMGKTSFLGTLGYKVFGDPTGIDLRNVFYGSVGLAYKLGPKNQIGATVDLREKTTATGTGLREYTVFYSYRIDQTYRLQTYLVVGDSRSSVDTGGGVVIAASW